MIGRRGFIGAVAGIAGAATVGAPPAEAAAVAPAPARDMYEPIPTVFDFERMAYDCDVCTEGVNEALSRIGWEPNTAPQAILCVHPRNWRAAMHVPPTFYGQIQLHALRFNDENTDAWFVAWRGRRAGSNGA